MNRSEEQHSVRKRSSKRFNPRDFDTVAPWIKAPNIILFIDDDIRYFNLEESSIQSETEISVKTVDEEDYTHQHIALVPEE